jgi:hypothetical protein
MISLTQLPTQVLDFLEELLYVFTPLHFNSILGVLPFDVINLFESIITVPNVISVLQLMRLKIMVTIDKMQFLHFTKFVHDVPAEVLADCELVQVYIFRSKTQNKKLDKFT